MRLVKTVKKESQSINEAVTAMADAITNGVIRKIVVVMPTARIGHALIMLVNAATKIIAIKTIAKIANRKKITPRVVTKPNHRVISRITHAKVRANRNKRKLVMSEFRPVEFNFYRLGQLSK